MANNPYVNKVQTADGTTIIDISDTTAVAADVASGKYFYDATGAKVQGTGSGGGGGVHVYQDENGYIVLDPDGGGGGDANPVAPEKQINFVDYDGAIRYSYSAAEFAELEELPANPTHEGRVAQGWNWTLAQINAQLAACPGGVVWVGQNYTTSDGKTHIHIVIPAGTPSSRRTFYVRYTQSVAYGVSIDWGDGSAPESHSSSGSNVGHTYAATGEYDISVYATSGTVSFVGSSSSSIFGPYENNYISSNIKDIVWGDDVTGIDEHILYYVMSGPKYMSFPNSLICSGEYLFGYNYGLRMVTVPEGTTSLPYRMFRYCYGLHRVVLPGSLSSIGHEAFAYCHGITEMTIPNGVTAIEYNAFTDCRSLTNLEIPASVTSIGDSAFSGCTGMGAYHIRATTPPTLGSSVFSSIPSDCVIYVPSSAVNAYKSATNWSAYSGYIQGE